MKVVDRTGQRSGRLVALRFSRTVRPTPASRRSWALWICRCDCGAECEVNGNNLHNGNAKSCGCLAAQKLGPLALANSAERALAKGKRGCGASWQLFTRYAQHAQRRGLSFTIKYTQFLTLTSAECSYCGREPHRVYASPRVKGYRYNGLDRVDNTIGYTPENIVPCCFQCNTAKRQQTVAEFYDWVRRVHERAIRKERAS